MALILREADAKALLTMPDTLRWVEESVRAQGEAQARVHPRQRVNTPRGTLHTLQAAELKLGVLGVKSYTVFREGRTFLLLLYSADNGRLLALIEANWFSMMRTGAASAIATKYMAREDAGTMAIFGTGLQAGGQIEAINLVRPLKEVRVYSRNTDRRTGFSRDMSEKLGLRVVPAASPAEALDGADIVTTVTTSMNPLFPGELVQPGTHVNAVGANALIRREIDEDLVRKANVIVVDSRPTAKTECGDLFASVEKGLLEWDMLPELAEVVIGRFPGRHSASDITLFESHGTALEDLAVAMPMYRMALEKGIGDEITLCENQNWSVGYYGQ